MAASCSDGGAAVCSDSDEHIRHVAGTVALKKVAAEGNLYTFRRPDYSAEEWRFLYLTTSTDLYIDSIRLVVMECFRKSACLCCITCGHSSGF